MTDRELLNLFWDLQEGVKEMRIEIPVENEDELQAFLDKHYN